MTLSVEKAVLVTQVNDTTMGKNKEIPLKNFTFGEVITGLQQGRVYTRWHDGSVITIQGSANIKAESIQKLENLCPKMKELLSIKKGLYYSNQVLKLIPMGDKVRAIAYQPTWEDIFANDWLDL